MASLRKTSAGISIFLLIVVVSSTLGNNTSGNKTLLECPGFEENPVISVIKGSIDLFRSDGVEQSDESWDSFRPMLIKCKAAYPITWDFSGSKPPDLAVETIVDVDNVLNPTKRCFYSNLKVLASGYTGKESRTGNYSCKSFDGKRQSSIYRFAHDGTSIFNTRKTLESKVYMKGGIGQVFIPCTANIANLNATVLKIHENGSFIPLDTAIEQKYDPKVGFLLKCSKDANLLVGKFVCSGTVKNDTEVVEITVSPATDFVVSPLRNHLVFRNSRLSMSCRSNEPVEMQLSKTNVQIQHHVRELMYRTDGYKYGAMADLFTHPTQDVLRGEVSCVKKNTSEVLFTWKYDTDYACRCNWTLKPDLFKTTRFFFLLDKTLRGTIRAFGLNTEGDSYYMNLPTPRGELSCTSPHSAKVNLTFIACENPVECQIKSSFLNWFDFDNRAYSESAFSDEEGEDTSNQTTISQGYIRSGLIKCGVEDYITTQIAIANLDTLYIDSIPTKNLVRIIAPESNVFVGDKMLFTCLYEKFQIAREAKFAFKYSNGSIGFIEVEKQDDRYSFDLEKYQRSSYIKIDSPDVESLMCFVPVWNSTLWKNTTFPLNVSSAIPVEKESPRNCPSDSSPIIILQRNSTISSRRIRIPHLVSNSTISLFSPVNEIQLICRANYPVQWVYNDEAQNTSKIGKVPCSFSSSTSSKKVYEAVLNVDPLKKESTGKYLCQKTFSLFPQSYVYIYAVGDGEATFVNEGRHMQVVKHTDDPNQKVTLPCQVSNPESKPYLFLDHEDSERIQKLELNDNLKYDPRKGFEMDMSSVPEPVTTFICSMSENASTFGVLITLRKQDGVFAAGSSSGYRDSSSGGNGMLIGITVILIILVILLTSGLVFMYKKCQDATTKTADVSQMGNTAGFSSYDDVRIQTDDRENIVDGNYNRFN